jgi:hypothetical protein
MIGLITARSVGVLRDEQEISALCPKQTPVVDGQRRDQAPRCDSRPRTSRHHIVNDSHENGGHSITSVHRRIQIA